MRKLTLLSATVLIGLSLAAQAWGATFKYKSNPHLPITGSQTVEDYIYVPTNVKMTNVRIGVYVKSIIHSCLRISLISPGGTVVLKAENTNNYYGSIGSPRSYCLFQDGGTAYGTGVTGQPFDYPTAPSTALSALNTKKSQGYWTLRVEDTRTGLNWLQNGYFENWVIMFNEVVVEPEIPIWSQTKSGAALIGMTDGQVQTIPNQTNGAALCTSTVNDPNGTLGLNGEAFPFIISGTGYPTHLIGGLIPGFSTPGRFKITVNVICSVPVVPPVIPSWTSDISVYFGRVANYTPPLQSPPSPPKNPGVAAAGWPRGSGNFATTLQGGFNALSNGKGGVLLESCMNAGVPDVPANCTGGWTIPGFDADGLIDCTFDDLALTSVRGATPNGATGTWRPMQPLSGLNGNLLEGLYYLTIYDSFGEALSGNFGHMRILSATVTYLAGGGETPGQNLHQGIAGPLMGVPIPGAITGAGFGYLPDVIGTIPPYSIHAKDQDPIQLMWATQKVGPRTAVGWERVQAVNPSNYIPPAGVLYDGPYAYPGALDANPQKAGVLVNSDVMLLPPNNYKFHLFLNQPRYDDDNSDNDFDSGPIQVTNTSCGYYGDFLQNQSLYNAGAGGGAAFQYPLPVNTGMGVAFSLFKFPTTRVTSIDFSNDLGFTAAPSNGNIRISVWRCSNGLVGAPTGNKVAVSPTVNSTDYHRGNWRSFPIQPCDASGNPIANTWGVDLAPGTYIVELDVMSGTHYIFGWPYGQLPFLSDRYKDYAFSENFGPLGPYSTTGTRLQYYNSNILFAPSVAMSSLFSPALSNLATFTLPIRMNFTNMNDFSIDYVNFLGNGATESLVITSAPSFIPKVYVHSNSAQNNQTLDFNVRLEIFNGSQTVYVNDKYYGPPTFTGIAPYGVATVTMPSWTPPQAGEYRVRASFSRNPDDQNPVNDKVEYMLRVTATRAILLTGGNVNVKDLEAAVSVLKDKGMSVTVSKASSINPKDAKDASVYFMGDIDDAAKANITSIVQNGTDVAMVYNASESYGNVLKTIDNVFDVDRGQVDYSNLGLPVPASETQIVTPAPKVPNLQIRSKEELVAAIKALNSTSIEPVVPTVAPSNTGLTNRSYTIPAIVSCPFGDLRFQNETIGNVAFSYITPSIHRTGGVKLDATTPSAFSMDQNYPNPFNPSTVINYTLPEASFVTLRILDVLGREVMTIVNRSQQAGGYTVTWKGLDQNGSAVAAGNYFYRLDAAPVNGGQPFSSMKKMTLAK
jgi:subtilisin-like proprotein convertase family protein